MGVRENSLAERLHPMREIVIDSSLEGKLLTTTALTLDDAHGTLRALNSQEVNHLRATFDAIRSGDCTAVYRGENLERLGSKLSPSGSAAIGLVAQLLFFFGDKAKYYAKQPNPGAREQWITPETSPLEVGSRIFDRIAKVVEIYSGTRWKRPKGKWKRLKEFFSNQQNRGFFSETLSGDQVKRDYYLYLLHVLGTAFTGDSSLLVSTSQDYNCALKFATHERSATPCIIHYVVADPFDKHAVVPTAVLSLEESLLDTGLPVLWPVRADESEVAVRGALFPHHIIGLEWWPKTGKQFVANPYVFKGPPTAVIKGLSIDQAGFEKYIHHTSYRSGVGMHFDGTMTEVFSSGEDIQ